MSESKSQMNIEYLWLASEMRQCPVPADGYLSLDEDEVEDQIFPLLTQLSDRHVFVDICSVIHCSHVIIARDRSSQKIVGMAVLAVSTPTFLCHGGRIEEVVVEERYRGQGIAHKMMGTLHDAARALFLTELWLTSNPRRVAANRLYQSIAYQRIETNLYRLTL